MNDEEFDYEQENEDEAFMEHRRKVITFVMCITLVVIVVVGSLLAYRLQYLEDKKMVEDSEQYNNELLPLYTERAKLQSEIAKLGPSPVESVSGYGTVMFLCTDPGVWIEDEVTTICDIYGVKCIIAVSENRYPGTDGSVSVGEMKKLLDDGWRLCISAQTAKQVKNVMTKLETDGFDVPDTVYFPSGTSEDSVDSFAELGIKYIITHGDEDGEIVWVAHALGCRELGTMNGLEAAVDSSECVVYTIGTLYKRESYTVSALNSMFSTVGQYSSSGKIAVTNDIENAYVRRMLFEGIVGSEEREYLEKKNELEKRLKEVEAEIMKYQSGDFN